MELSDLTPSNIIRFVSEGVDAFTLFLRNAWGSLVWLANYLADSPEIAAVALALLVAAALIFKRYRRTCIRLSTKEQRKRYKKAKALYRKVKYSNLTDEELIDWTIDKGGIDGWVFELFVIMVLSRSLKLQYVGDIKLTADAGLDGVLVSKDQIYFLQSKYYSNYISTVTLSSMAQKSASFNKRDKSNNWHKVLGIPKKFTRNLDRKSVAVVATTGKLSKANRDRVEVSKIRLLDWATLVFLIRKDQKKINNGWVSIRFLRKVGRT